MRTSLLLSLAAALSISPLSAQSTWEHPDGGVLDFMEGVWSVQSDGEELGELRVTRSEGHIAWSEEFTSYEYMTTTSLLSYNPRTEAWTRYSVFANGETSELTGHPVGDGFVFEGRITSVDWVVRRTISPQADGTIVILVERSLDEGRSWETSRESTLHPLF